MIHRTMVQNRNLLFVIGYKSYFLTNFEFYFIGILSIKFLTEFFIFFHKEQQYIKKKSDKIGHFNFVNFELRKKCLNKLTIVQNNLNCSHRTQLISLIFNLIIIKNFYKQIFICVYFSSKVGINVRHLLVGYSWVLRRARCDVIDFDPPSWIL